MRGLDGKRIIIAGSATGIGKATARRLTEEGARLLLGDIAAEKLEQTATELGVPWRTFDLVDDASVNALVDAAKTELGGLDGVANIAADLSPETIGRDVDLLEMDVEIWKRTLDADLIGFARIMKRAIPLLLESGGGAIVSVSSDAAIIGEPTRPAYAAAKAGIEALTRHVASRWGKENIRAMAVAPGMVLSEAAKANVGEEFLQQMLVTHRLPRLGEPEDMAAIITFLLSDDAQWFTGQTWSANGGAALRR